MHNKMPEDYDPTKPGELILGQINNNEPLPSYSNRVNIEQFSVGNYKEFQLKDELAHLIERYNQKFNGDARKPVISKLEIKETRYQDKMIINPIAVPDPNSAEGNFSWMYLITPYYNNLVKEFNQKQMENHVLNQHFEYYVQMQEEKNLLNQEFEMLQNSERALMDKVTNTNNENQILEDKMMNQERNLNQVQPERLSQVNEKLENLNNILHAKDGVIDQLLNEITLIKNEKDDLQNEALFKKQRIENLNMEFNTKELEYQRLWEDSQNLKAEIRGETNDATMIKRENEMLTREIAQVRDDVNENYQIYEINQSKIQEGKSLLQDYESRLRYGNDVIMSLETEQQQVQLDIAQAKATVEGQNRAYNELRNNYYMISQSSDPKMSYSSSASAMMSVPKVIMPSNYYRPSAIASKNTINLMPSTSKAMTQQVAPSNIKSYLSIKKATIDLTSDLSAKRNNNRDQKVRFSIDGSGSSPTGGLANLPANQKTNINMEFSPQQQRRSDSMDSRIERRNMKGLNQDQNQDNSNQRITQRQNSISHQVPNERVGSVNRNFIDTMSGLLGMSDEQQKFVNMRASQAQNTFPLKRADLDSNQNSPNQLQSFIGSPEKVDYRNMETDISTDMGRNSLNNSNMWTQTPLKNKVTCRGAPGNRSSQPQQINSVKQKQHPMSTKNQGFAKQEEEKYRQNTWGERMSALPKQSAYRSSIAFGYDGMTVKEEPKKEQQQYHHQQQEQHPFQIARDYDVDMDTLNESDPQARLQIAKFKQQKIFELQDQRNTIQSQLNHIPEHSKQLSQRHKKQELETDLQKLTKRISQLKYDVKKMNSKAIDD